MNNIRGFLGIAATIVLLAGCGGSDNSIDSEDDTGGSLDFQSKVIDAKSYDTATYLNLTTGKTLNLTAKEAQDSADWHLSFQRDGIQVNSGALGAGNLAGAVAEPQDKFYDASGNPNFSLLKAASPDTEEAALLAAYPEPKEWYGGEITNRFGDKWYEYDVTTHSVVGVSSLGWLVRSAEGDSYARMRVEKLKFDPKPTATDNSFIIKFDVQPAGAEQWTNLGLTFEGALSQKETCFDFDAGIAAGEGANAGAIVDCKTSDLWDVKLVFDVATRSIELRTNSGVSGDGDAGVLGEFDWDDLAMYGKGTENPSGASLTRLYAADASGVFSASSWNAYDQAGGHVLRPNYRVYLIDTDADDAEAPVYTVQIISYYGEDGDSGQPIIRWTETSLTTEAN